MPVVEAAIGVVMIVGIAGLLALGTPSPTAADPQLDVYADDVATVLDQDAPRHGGTTRLDEVSRSSDAFDREADAIEERVDELLPDTLLFRIETPHGTVGFERPDGAAFGTLTVTTQHGTVVIEVWHP